MGRALTDLEGDALVRLARAAIEDALSPRERVATVRRSIELTAGLLGPRGVFVTLERTDDGRLALRGCIGSTEPDEPLHEAVVATAIHAALHDPRFDPVTREEYASIAVSVSALTSPVRILAEAIVPGEDGVILEHPEGRAIFLPEVAADHGWTLEELLVHLCRKGGLSDRAWREATLFGFRSQKFSG